MGQGEADERRRQYEKAARQRHQQSCFASGYAFEPEKTACADPSGPRREDDSCKSPHEGKANERNDVHETACAQRQQRGRSETFELIAIEHIAHDLRDQRDDERSSAHVRHHRYEPLRKRFPNGARREKHSDARCCGRKPADGSGVTHRRWKQLPLFVRSCEPWPSKLGHGNEACCERKNHPSET